MTRKDYEKPTMQVVELKQQPQLLAGSMTGNRDNPYGEPEDPWASSAPFFNDNSLFE